MSDDEYMRTDKSLHPDGTRYQVLLSYDRALSALDEWLSSGSRADLRVRRARTPRMVVIETLDVLYASRLVLQNAGCQANIVFPKPDK